jgi:hypothetical protein
VSLVEARRYPLEPLLAMMDSGRRDAAVELGISGRTRARLLRDGLTERQADRFAVRVGLHPWTVWPDLELHALHDATEAEERAREKQRAAWRRSEAKRMQDPAYRAAKAEYVRQYRETSRKAAAATSRRYYAANRERLLAAQARRDAARRASRAA